MTPAQRWGGALDREMTRQRMTATALAERLGCNVGAVRTWRRGARLPRYQSAVAAAEALLAPSLASLATELATKRCDVCGRRFVDTTYGLLAIRCSDRCQSTADGWRARGRAEDRHALNSKRVRLYSEAVDRLCREWCPNDGLCPDAACPIQQEGLSPLPVAVVGERTIGALRPAHG